MPDGYRFIDKLLIPPTALQSDSPIKSQEGKIRKKPEHGHLKYQSPPAMPFTKGNGSRPYVCFWCDEQMTKKTKTNDHLISSSLRKLLGEKKISFSGNHVVWSCFGCNQKRARISTTLGASVKPSFKGVREKMWKRLLPVIHEFEDKIRERLTGQMQEICLLEIMTILERTLGAIGQLPVRGDSNEC